MHADQFTTTEFLATGLAMDASYRTIPYLPYTTGDFRQDQWGRIEYTGEFYDIRFSVYPSDTPGERIVVSVDRCGVPHGNTPVPKATVLAGPLTQEWLEQFFADKVM